MISENLMSTAKNYLEITWNDEDTNLKLRGILQRGIKYLNDAACNSLNYEIPDKPQELLLEYARYARSNMLQDFQDNYLSEILTLQIGSELGKYD